MFDKKVKYLIFDIGGVLLYPTSGHWFITPTIYNLLNDKLNMNSFISSLKTNYDMVDEISLKTEEEECSMFYSYYKKSLEDIGANIPDELILQMSESITYGNDRYTFYDDVIHSLEILSKRYTLVILSDNFPSIKRILKEKKIDKYFKLMFISTFCGYRKKDKVMFQMLKDNIQYEDGEAVFIDDSEFNLDIASSYGLVPIRMIRDGAVTSKYSIINGLSDIL